MKIVILYLSFISLSLSADPPYHCEYCQPEQIHLAYGENPNDIVVTWSTPDNPQEAVVEYGEKEMGQTATGTVSKFVDGGKQKRVQYIHRVTLKGLKFDTKYVYHVGSKFGWSDEFTFKVPPEGNNWVVRAAIYGDMGIENAHSLPYLQQEAERDKFDLILHVGDFAYDMYEQEGRVGDQFLRQVQPIAGRVPYMVCPGNHEEAYNFSNYRNRFSMPGDSQSMFYSFNLGPIHFVSIATEYYYFLKYGSHQLVRQYDWLVQDLKEANKPENRAARPWLVLMGHRPMYCSNDDDPDCSLEYTRTGIPFIGAFGLEKLLKEFGVDLALWAHEHSYERSWPLYDNLVYNGTSQPYVNPRAPIHVVTGSAGCREKTDTFVPSPPDWSAFRSSDYGYSRLIAYNHSHIYIEQVDVDLKGQVIDSFWIVKDNHAPYTFD